MNDHAEYLHLKPGASLPALWLQRPFRTVLIADVTVAPEWQAEVSDWLVRSGCLYVMAWGQGSKAWDDAVDAANLDQFDYADIPREHFVMTTWHADETLEEVLWFAKSAALHPAVPLQSTLLLHISQNNEEGKLVEAYVNA